MQRLREAVASLFRPSEHAGDASQATALHLSAQAALRGWCDATARDASPDPALAEGTQPNGTAPTGAASVGTAACAQSCVRPVDDDGPQGRAARGLAESIEAARERAIAEGVQPIPAAVYRGLLGYFPAALLQRARFASGRRAVGVPALTGVFGHRAAVTLGDVILFRDERRVRDLELWAHHLTHVMQVQRWGLAEFAAHYVTDSRTLEQEANDNAARFAAWQSRRTG